MNKPTEDLEVAERLSHVQIPATLREKIDPKHTALIVVDMQNDFCASGGMMANEGFDLSEVQKMASRLPTLLSAARSAGVLVIFVRNVYSTSIAHSRGQNKPANMYLSDSGWSRRRGPEKAATPEGSLCVGVVGG